VTDASKPFDEDVWELYHVEEDFSESRDLAGEYPDKLRELQDIWWIEAARNNVLPMDARSIGRGLGRPRLTTSRSKRFVYYPGGAPIEAAAAVNTKNRSHTITAEVDIPAGGAEGVIVADGGRFGGYALYVRAGKLCYSYNFLGKAIWTFTSDIDVPAGKGTLGCGFEKTGPQPFGPGGVLRLYINGTACGEGQIPRTVPFMFGLGVGFQIGRDEGNPVTDDYASPFRFTGTLRRVIVDVSGPEPPRDLEQEAIIEMARQ
jgi:hypothetical protein